MGHTNGVQTVGCLQNPFDIRLWPPGNPCCSDQPELAVAVVGDAGLLLPVGGWRCAPPSPPKVPRIFWRCSSVFPELAGSGAARPLRLGGTGGNITTYRTLYSYWLPVCMCSMYFWRASLLAQVVRAGVQINRISDIVKSGPKGSQIGLRS